MPVEQLTGSKASELPLPPNTTRDIRIKLPNGKEVTGSRASLINTLAKAELVLTDGRFTPNN
ncbi:MAG: hypothetical protein HY431_01490 [Candidatus Levybacteria bacterium]|nr:hypothetical protein [Candidatus Levybacteria bacterium]